MRQALEDAGNADVALVMVGGSTQTCSEDRDRTHLSLPGSQLALVQGMYACMCMYVCVCMYVMCVICMELLCMYA